MMERLVKLRRILDALEADSSTPWYLVEIVHQLIEIVSDLDDLAEWHDKFDASMVEQQMKINSLETKYSELLYKLKSGE